MKVYLISAKKRKTKIHEKIIGLIQKFGHEVIFELIDSKNEKQTNKFDLIIADIEQTSTSLGCAILMAASERKPVLCIYDEKLKNKADMLIPEQEKYLKFISAKSFNPNNLKEVIGDFIEEKDEQMRDRFNFFVSSDISNYLNWITFSRQQSRADFIRGLVRDQLKQDNQYRSYLENKNNK
ncbi:MAG: hypothetical protein ABIG90_01895 [bacterium]